MFKIGNIEIKNRIVLAPMAGICNSAFRKIIKEMGVGLIYAEMVSDKALVYSSKKTEDMLYMEECERPIAQQIFGSDKETFVEAAKLVYEKMHPDIIDINMGCPAPKVVKNGDGSKLLLDLELVSEIVKSVVAVSKVPVTVKIRKGWDDEHIVAVEAAKRIEAAGASAITIHGRTRSQFYSGVADWDIIKAVKENVSIPVIGNGDVIDGKSAEELFARTHVDGIMIGRATLGNPWIFKEVSSYLKGEEYTKPSNDEVLNTILRQYEMLIQEKGEYTSVREMRKHVAWYVKGMKSAKAIKTGVNEFENFEEVKKFLIEYFK